MSSGPHGPIFLLLLQLCLCSQPFSMYCSERTGKVNKLSDDKRVQCEDRCVLNLETGEITSLMIPLSDPSKPQVKSPEYIYVTTSS